MKTRDVVILAGLGGLVAWFVVSKIKGAGAAVLNAPAALGSKIGLTLYDWIHPDTVGESLYYMVTFPDGARHSIASHTVDSSGRFSWGGQNYVMKSDASGFHHAIAA
jgi:hypothetical protein